MTTKKWYQDANMLVAFSAVLISLIALGVGIYEANLERQYQSASVWPRLEVFRSYQKQKWSYGVTNSGIGPAIVKYAKVTSKNKYYTNWTELIAELIDKPKGSFTLGNSYIGKRVLPAESNYPIVWMNEISNDKLNSLSQFNIELCYCSVYDECWTVDKSNLPEPVEFCRIDENLKFLQ